MGKRLPIPDFFSPGELPPPNLLAGTVDYPPCCFEEEVHSHNFYQVVIVLEGEFHFSRPQFGKTTAGAGQALLLAPGCAHGYGNCTDSWCRTFMLNLQPPDSTQFGVLAAVFPPQAENELRLIDLDMPLVRPVIEEMVHEAREASASRGLMLHSLLLKLLTLVGRATEVVEISDPVVPPAIDFIAANYASEFSVEELAQHCGLAVSRFHERFLKVTGVSPMRYVIQYRLRIAANLLCSTRYTAAEVAAKVGYHSPQHFSRAFRETWGCSPGQFRT